MTRVIITRAYLRRLRNEVPFPGLFRKLNWPHKRVGTQLRFVCPSCSEHQTSVNPTTNLARCFRCERNWNPIDFTMTITNCEFLQAVAQLEDLLPNP
jgi:DNA primase